MGLREGQTMDTYNMDARNHGISATSPPEAKAIWLPQKPSPLKGLVQALHRLSAPSVGLSFRSAGGFNPRRFWRWCALLAALVMVFGAASVRGQEAIDTVFIDIDDGKSSSKDFASYMDRFMKRVVAELAAKNVRVILNLPSSDLPDIDVRVMTRPPCHPEFDTYIQMNVIHFNLGILADISPIIKSRHDWFSHLYLIEYPMQNQSAADAMVNTVVGFSLYSINRCDLASSYLDVAQQNLGRLVGIDANNLRATVAFYQGNCALIHEDYYSAIRFYDYAVKTYVSQRLPGNAPEVNQAWSYIQIGETQKAFGVMDDLISKEQHEGRLRLGEVTNHMQFRAQLNALVDRYNDAITDLTTAIKLNSENPAYEIYYLYTLRGQMYLALYEWDKALADYNTALNLAPDYADAYYYRGVLYASILQTGLATRDDALADFRQYLELAPDGDHAADAAQAITNLEAAKEALNDE